MMKIWMNIQKILGKVSFCKIIDFDQKYAAENRERILNLIESYQDSIEITKMTYNMGDAIDKLNSIKNEYGSKKEICLDENCKNHHHEKKI